MRYPATRRSRRYQYCVCGATALFFAAALAFRVEQGTDTALWATALALTLLCGAVIMLVWYFAFNLHEFEGVAVTNRAAVDRYIELYTKSLSRSEVPVRVPTGIQLTTIRFPRPDVGAGQRLCVATVR